MCLLEHEGNMGSLAWSNVIWYTCMYILVWWALPLVPLLPLLSLANGLLQIFVVTNISGNRQTSICRTNHINWKIFDYQLRLKFQEAGLNTVDGGQAFLFYNRRTVTREFRLLVFHESSSRGPLIRTLNIVGFGFKFAEIFFRTLFPRGWYDVEQKKNSS
jgi:hypothetical protein